MNSEEVVSARLDGVSIKGAASPSGRGALLGIHKAKSSKLTNGDAMKYEQVHLSHSYCIAQKSKRARSVTF